MGNKDNSISILNLNVQGLGLARRRYKSTFFAASLPNYNPDIFIITETQMVNNQEIQNISKLIPQYECAYTLGTQRRNGVICGVKKSKFKIIDYYPDAEGRFVVMRARNIQSGNNIHILGVYAPTREGDRVEFWQEIGNFTTYNF